MNTNEHELMTEEMRRIRSERDFLAKIIGEAATEELKRNRRTIEALEEEVELLESNLAQALAGLKPDDYSN